MGSQQLTVGDGVSFLITYTSMLESSSFTLSDMLVASSITKKLLSVSKFSIDDNYYFLILSFSFQGYFFLRAR